MKSKEQITKEFMDDLRALLRKYNAELSADDHFSGYAECGEDVRMTVDIEGDYDNDGNELRPSVEIDLGKYVRV